MLPYMDDFSAYLMRYVGRQPAGYDVIHANFFMSAMAALPVAQYYGVPLAVTFHALGKVRRQYQQSADLFPDSRFDIEDDIARRADRLIAECPQDRRDLIELYAADPRRIDIVPCADAAEMTAQPMALARKALGWDDGVFTVLQLGRMVPRSAWITSFVPLRGCATAMASRHGCAVGGNTEDASELATPEIGRLRGIAREEGVAEWVEFGGPAAARGTGRLLQRERRVCDNTLVRAVWHYARRGDGVRASRDRRGHGRNTQHRGAR